MTTPDNVGPMFVGVQVSPVRITALTFDNALRQVGKSKRSTKPERGANAVVSRIARAITDAVDEADGGLPEVGGVGVAVCAEFDPQRARPDSPLIMEWARSPLLPALQELLPVPVGLIPVGAACVLGAHAQWTQSSAARFAAVFLEEELAGGMIRDGELEPTFDSIAIGEDRWLDWGDESRTLPGKKRYHKLSRRLSKGEPEALEIFSNVTAQLKGVLSRVLDQFNPDVIALVGLGAEELKDALMARLVELDGLGERLARAGCMVPALKINACRLGAALSALKQTDPAQQP